MTSAEALRHFNKRNTLQETENQALRTALEAMHVAYRTRVQRHEIESKLIADGDVAIVNVVASAEEQAAAYQAEIERLKDSIIHLTNGAPA